jgi:outer membrane receptor protein involved in Fe transport
MLRKRATGLVALTLLCLTFTPAAFAQVNTATLLGQVTDSSGAAVPNAAVTARNLTTNFERSTATDAEGNYFLASLPLGPYQLEVKMGGFRTEVRSGVTLAAGDRTRLDVALTAGQVTESVTVNAEAPLVNTASPERGVVIDSAKVAELPVNGRDFTRLVLLQPGVQSYSINNRTMFSFNGSTAFGMNITLDGTDASFIESPSFGDPSNRGLINTVSLDSIQEFRVQTGTFTAETGRASSGAVNVQTKSGTNSYHGSLFEYFRNDALDARTFFAARKDPRRQNQFGGSFGGPIIKDRAFFFAAYEAARLRVNQQLTATVPTAAFRAQAPADLKAYLDLVPLPTEAILVGGQPNPNAGVVRRSDQYRSDENLMNLRGDYNTTRSLNFVRYSLNKSENSVPNVLPTNRQVFTISNHLATVSNTYTVSPTMVNEVRLGYNRWFVPRLNTTWNGGNGVGEVTISGLLTATNFEGFLRFADESYTFADNLSLRRGQHALKTGVEIRRLISTRIQKQNPVYTFNNAADFLANRPARVRVIFGQPGVAQRQTQTGIFLQDDWQVSSRLTLNLGLRYEYYSVISGSDGRLFNVVSDPFGEFRPRGAPIYAKDFNNLNPRLGLSWDVDGKRQTVFRAGYGVYTSPAVPLFIWDTPTIDPRQPFFTDFTPADIPNLRFPISGSLRAAVVDPTTALSLGLIPRVIGRKVVDPDFRDTYNLMWNASIQRQLFSPNWALEVGYVGAHNLKTVQTRLVNLIDPVTRRRPNPNIGEIQIVENAGRRKYHALQASLRARASRNLTADVHYTWGHAIVYGGDDCCAGSASTRIQDYDNIAGSAGDAAADLRHVLTFNYSYALPVPKQSNAFLSQLLENWAVQGISRLRSGLAFTALSGADRRGNGVPGTQRVNYVGGSPYTADRTINAYLNPQAFAMPAAGTFGNIGFNTLRGPKAIDLDISLRKSFPVWREQELQFRAEFFNFPNRANFNNPVNNFSNPAFGRIQTAGAGRNVQLSLRYQF